MTSAERLTFFAAEVARLRLNAANSAHPAFHETVLALKRFQAARLALTHRDLLESSRYAQATRFFLDDLYGAKDFSQRDAELERVIPTLVRFLPEGALSTLADAVELDALSEDLDQKMTTYALERLGVGLAGSRPDGPGWTAERYAQAYRGIDSAQERQIQLELVPRIGRTLDKLVKSALLGGLLRGMAKPARLAGVATMHDFLVRGYTAFHSMKGAAEFLARVDERERDFSRRLLAGEPGAFPEADGRASQTGP